MTSTPMISEQTNGASAMLAAAAEALRCAPLPSASHAIGVEWAVEWLLRRAQQHDHPAEPEETDTEHQVSCQHVYVWFDRTICPPPCNSMHERCDECGATIGGCPYEDLHA